MTVVSEEILQDLKLTREILSTTDNSVVVTNYGKIWKKKKRTSIQQMEQIRHNGLSIFYVSLRGQ